MLWMKPFHAGDSPATAFRICETQEPQRNGCAESFKLADSSGERRAGCHLPVDHRPARVLCDQSNDTSDNRRAVCAGYQLPACHVDTEVRSVGNHSNVLFWKHLKCSFACGSACWNALWHTVRFIGDSANKVQGCSSQQSEQPCEFYLFQRNEGES